MACLSRLFTAAALLASIDAIPANAACLADEPALVWSLPADGDVDVPANTKLFVLTTSFGDFTVEVDGVVVQPDAEIPSMFTPGDLPPGEHIVELIVIEGGGQRRIFDSFVFSTNEINAARQSDAPTLARLESVTDRQFSETCSAAFSSIDCFDQGQDTHYVVDTPAADGFLVTAFFQEDQSGNPMQRLIWPGECGRPEAFLVGGRPDKCLDVATIGFGGVSPSSLICEGPVGCSQASSPALFALLLFALRRRR